MVPFAELVLVRRPVPSHRGSKAERQHKGDSQWVKGIWIGRSETTDEHLAWTIDGFVRTRTIRRLPAEKRRAPELVQGLQAVPWDTGRKTKLKDPVPHPVPLLPEPAAQPQPTPKPAEDDMQEGTSNVNPDGDDSKPAEGHTGKEGDTNQAETILPKNEVMEGRKALMSTACSLPSPW